MCICENNFESPTLTGVAQIAEIATPKNAIESVIRSWGAAGDMTDSQQVGSENTPHLRNHLSKLIPVVYICQRRQRQHKNQRLRQPFTTPNPSWTTRIPIRWNRLIQVLQLLTAKLPTVNLCGVSRPPRPLLRSLSRLTAMINDMMRMMFGSTSSSSSR